MFKGNITTSTTVSADSNIPFKVVLNTNGNTRYNSSNNTVSLLSSGYYNVNVLMTVADVATSPVAIQLFADGQPITEALAQTDITATTGVETLNISDVIRVVPSQPLSFANISVQSSDAITITNAIFTVEKVR